MDGLFELLIVEDEVTPRYITETYEHISWWMACSNSMLLRTVHTMKYSEIYNWNLRAYLLMDGLFELHVVEDGAYYEIFRDI
jgi:hypothetical protein